MSNVTRYFDATIDGHQRITVASGDDNEISTVFRDREELSERELPADFSSWKVYAHGAGYSHEQRTLSRRGD